MLDLRELKQKIPYQMKLEDGTILDIKLPSQLLLEKMINLEQYKNKTEETLAIVYEIATDIFNNNTNGLSFTLEEVKNNYGFTICVYIIQNYLQEVNKHLGEL